MTFPTRFHPAAGGHADADSGETQEWLDALEAVVGASGSERGQFLMETLLDQSRRLGINLPYSANTAYINTIPLNRQAHSPGDHEIEHSIRSAIRWNAMALVLRANRKNPELGGHIASFASSATLYDVGFNHFFHAGDDSRSGDLVFFQGHSAPGIYARAFVEGRLSEKQLDRFRMEIGGGGGLSSYPHPRLMPDFWQFPTVSMGLGPLTAVYQARFMRYLHDRGLADTSARRVWCFVGDGEMDEPESTGALSLAGRERLGNLTFVVNCNLQRLDGPVRGNGKIVQELEALFYGAGWNVIKVLWGSYWDGLLAQDRNGLLKQLMMETVDGEYQNCKANGGAYTRESFFGKYPELKQRVETMSDRDIWRLNRGGHDPHKVYAAYSEALKSERPTVILAKTVKGYGMGEAGEGQNTTHQQKKLEDEQVLAMRDRFRIPLPDKEARELKYISFAKDSPELKYMRARREELGGSMPRANPEAPSMKAPPLDIFKTQLEGSGERAFSTTMAMVRMLVVLTRGKEWSSRIVPIIPDEARTFGMEGMFRQLGIYSSVGQLYEPQDHDQIMFYKEDKNGQILQEGINEAGAFSSWIAAATSHSIHSLAMVPFYLFYSMFGFQRVGDLAWLAGDMGARGFLVGGTAGRTTLAGEGLQHQDGQSHVMASHIPNCLSYDPCYAYEMAVIVHAGLKRMLEQRENVFYYLTAMNENYAHPPMPKGAEEGIIKGLYRLRTASAGKAAARLFGSGTILREALAAAELLEKDWNVPTEVWSVTSFNELARDGRACERARLHGGKKKPYVTSCILDSGSGSDLPTVAATDYVRQYADQIRAFVPGPYKVLGTDGFGRSAGRAELRRFFEVDRHYIAVSALEQLAEQRDDKTSVVTRALKKYGLETPRPDPTTV